jgi:hypothetical protein
VAHAYERAYRGALRGSGSELVAVHA